MKTHRRRTAAVLAAAGLFAALLAVAPITPSAGAADSSPAPARSNKPAKMTPRLAALAAPDVATASAQAQALATSTDASGPGSLLHDDDGRLLVDARLHDASAAGAAQLESVGAEVIAHDADLGLATVAIATGSLTTLAAHPNVIHLVEILTPLTSADLRPAGGGVDPGPSTLGTCPTNILSEGDAQLNALPLRTFAGIDGAGVRVGVLSDSYDNLTGAATDVSEGDLPGAANTCGYTTPVVVQSDLASGGTDEGRAMAQIVHDLAPGAEIAMASAFNGELDFSQQVTALAAGGADVIVDDVIYFSEPMFQEGVIAKAMNDAVAAGVPVFSAGGNSSRVVGGKQVGGYETDAFRPATCPTGIPAYNNNCHDFDPGVGTTAEYSVTVNSGGTVRVSLGWNEPQYGVSTDLDLYLLSAANVVLASSEGDNTATTKAWEGFSYTNGTGISQTYRIVVGRYNGSPDPTGTPRFRNVLNRSTGLTAVGFDTDSGGDTFGHTLYGHAGARDVYGLGATPYDNQNAVETFSALGPNTICWEPVVGAVAASALGGGCVTETIEATATDGGANSFFGSFISSTWRFYGTSAAAPHAAAVAALLRESAPCRTPDEIYTALSGSAVDLGLPTNQQGAGRIDALGAFLTMPNCLSTISGTVTEDGTGTPLEGISVRLNRTSDNVTIDKVATDASGNYTFSDVPAGTYIMRFVDLDGLHIPEFHSNAMTRFTATTITTSSESTHDIDAVLVAGGIGNIRGTVTEDGSGTPLQGISVRLLTTGNVLLAARNTKADGSFAYDLTSFGDYTMRFIDPDASHVNEFHLNQPNRFTATVITHNAWFTYVNAGLAPT